jgi:hypothetical protein
LAACIVDTTGNRLREEASSLLMQDFLQAGTDSCLILCWKLEFPFIPTGRTELGTSAFQQLFDSRYTISRTIGFWRQTALTNHSFFISFKSTVT